MYGSGGGLLSTRGVASRLGSDGRAPRRKPAPRRQYRLVTRSFPVRFGRSVVPTYSSTWSLWLSRALSVVVLTVRTLSLHPLLKNPHTLNGRRTLALAAATLHSTSQTAKRLPVYSRVAFLTREYLGLEFPVSSDLWSEFSVQALEETLANPFRALEIVHTREPCTSLRPLSKKSSRRTLNETVRSASRACVATWRARSSRLPPFDGLESRFRGTFPASDLDTISTVPTRSRREARVR